MRLILIFSFLFVSQITWSQAVKSATTQAWKNSGWVTTGRVTNTQDAKGHLILTLNEGYNDSLKSWYNKTQRTFTNNTNGKPLFFDDYQWVDSTKSWLKTNSCSQTYDSAGNVMEKIAYVLSSGSLVPDRKTFYEYNAANLLIKDSTFGYNGTAWVRSTRSSYAYNNAGSLTLNLSEMFVFGYWAGQFKVIQNYNAQNQRTEYILLTSYLANWHNNTRYLYFYRPDGRIDYVDYYYGGDVTPPQHWYFQYKMIYEYQSSIGLDFVIVTAGQNKTQTITSYFPPNTTGIKDYSPMGITAPIYFDLNGRPTEKRSNEVLIEVQGTKKRKVLFSE